MPLSTNPTAGQATWKLSVAGPDNVEFMIEGYTALSTEGEADAVTQSLVNHLATWPDLVALTYAQKITTAVYAFTPDSP